MTPERVAILGLGPSVNQFVEFTKRNGSRKTLCDEVWGINALGDVFNCDKIFHMDDVRVQEIRAKAEPASNISAMLEWLKTTDVPVITSRAHPDYPALQEFPLEDVLNSLQFDYFNSTAAYAVVYAIHIGVKELSLFGVDYTYPNVHDAEKGRACVEFWLGIATARGIKIRLPKTTSLMDAMMSREKRLYGYDTQKITFNKDGKGGLKLEFKDLEELPTAEQVEASYDHSVHPNPLMEEAEDDPVSNNCTGD